MPQTTNKNDGRKSLVNRREFIAAAAGAIAAPLIIPASARGADGHVAPSNRIAVAQIGMGRMGRARFGASRMIPRWNSWPSAMSTEPAA